MTGQPWSDKSKVVAGLLQIFLGGFAVGRFYTGHVRLAVGQLAVVWGVVGLFCCLGAIGSLAIVGAVLFFFMPLGTVWPLVDGIILLAKGGTDSQGRVLRP